jgi:hypothetical protein
MNYDHITDIKARNRRIAYKTWYHMHHRCNGLDPVYEGVTVSKEWSDFEVFYRDMGDRPSDDHSLDRVKGSKIYSKSTCKWSTRFEQSGNRPGFTIDIKYNGSIYNLKALCRLLNKPYLNAYHNFRAGKSLQSILGVSHDSIELV